MRWYRLEGKTPVPCTMMEAASLIESDDRIVARTEVGSATVSTVFLALDHNHGRGPPLLFETMIFTATGAAHGYQERYATWDEAESGHARAVAVVERDLDLGKREEN